MVICYFLFEDVFLVVFLVDFLAVVLFAVVVAVVFVAVAVVVAAGATYLAKAGPLFIPSKLLASDDTVLRVLLPEYLLTLPTTSRSLLLSKVRDRLLLSNCA